VHTDEWKSYQGMPRQHRVVRHGQREGARDDDGDGVREMHINTAEGMWTSVRNFLCPFRGVHKRYLSGYVAISEFTINDKRVPPVSFKPFPLSTFSKHERACLLAAHIRIRLQSHVYRIGTSACVNNQSWIRT
jgi:hypothetical protein